MAAGFIGGAFLGAVFGEVLNAVRKVATKATKFKPCLKKLQSTLNQITPLLEDHEKLNRILDRPPKETTMFTDRILEGKNLVLKCAKVRRWNIYAKALYTKKLITFEKSLARFFQIDVTMQISVDSKRILDKVNGFIFNSTNNISSGNSFMYNDDDDIFGVMLKKGGQIEDLFGDFCGVGLGYNGLKEKKVEKKVRGGLMI